MSLKSALIAGLLAAACAGCAASSGSMAGEGQAFPSTRDSRAWDDRVGEQCSGGTMYNRASGLCVSSGP